MIPVVFFTMITKMTVTRLGTKKQPQKTEVKNNKKSKKYKLSLLWDLKR